MLPKAIVNKAVDRIVDSNKVGVSKAIVSKAEVSNAINPGISKVVDNKEASRILITNKNRPRHKRKQHLMREK